MKIKAIRLNEVGRFREPIALEGLSGGLDVLAGPNELGKSTILKALRRALESKYTSKTKDIEALRPYGGGAPLVELDLEIDGKTWRLRKRFLSSPSAELKDLSTGAIARGGDAETELAKLLKGASEAERLGLLWVDQGKSLAAVVPADKARSALVATIEGEVETVADGGVARAVEAYVEAELAEFVTKKAERPTGRYKDALTERERLRAELNGADVRLQRAQDRLDRLQQVRARIAQLANPAAAAGQAEAATAGKRALEEAGTARAQLRRAEETMRAHQETFDARKSALAGLEGKLADLAKLEALSGEAAPQITELTGKASEGEAHESACRQRHEDLRAALAKAERERKAIEAAARLQELAQRLETARTDTAEREQLAQALAGNGAQEKLVVAVRNAAGRIATIEARLSAAAPAVVIAYARGGAGKIKVEGRALADGETLAPTQPVAIEIEGIGVITVAPGRSQSVDKDEAELSALKTQLSEDLRRVGAQSLEEAEQRLAERRDLQGRLAEIGARLETLAPKGLERLEQAHAELAAQLQGFDAGARTQEEVEAAARDRMDELAAAEATLREATAAHAAAREALMQATARSDARRAQIESLTSSLGDEVARTTRRDNAVALLADAETALNKAVRDHAAWRETAPDDARFAELKGAAETAEATRAKAERELVDLRRVEAGIEGELTADRDEDVESHVAELKESCALAEARVADLEQETAALQLLSRELATAAQTTRDRFAKPVMDRLGPYLDLVFPDARAHLGDGYALSALERAGGVEDLGHLSQGTQEQLAVLVRLGFGRLLAETGAPAPLILDDALVYADDTRIERMFEALKLGAQSHQVLVLTCRERTFAVLEGNRVAIGAWRPD